MSNRIISLDLLRFFAASAVAIPHILIVNHGHNNLFLMETLTSMGVEIFFALSGFVLTPILFSISAANLNLYKMIRIFFIRRWLRTLPLFFAAGAVFFLLFGPPLKLETLSYFLFLQNFSSAVPRPDFFSIAWSLSVEEWFYLFFPIFVLPSVWLWGNISPTTTHLKRFVTCTILFFLVPSFLRLSIDITTEDFRWGADLRRVVVFRLDAIAAGSLTWLLFNFVKLHGFRFLIWSSMVTSYAVLFVEFSRIEAGIANTFEMNTGIFWLLTLASCLTVLSTTTIRINEKSFLNHFAQWGGTVSYGIYLFHIPVTVVVMHWLEGVLSPILVAVISLFVVFLLTDWLYKNYELPFLKRRPSYPTLLNTSDTKSKNVSGNNQCAE